MYKAIIRFSGLSDSVFYHTTGYRSVYYNKSIRNLYKDMSSLARLIRRNKQKFNLRDNIRITFRIYDERWLCIGDRFYF